MARSIILMTLVAAGSLCIQSSSPAQSPVLAELYGRGVHAYYGGDLLDAHRYLTMAIENGSQDPRAFYFRGIVNASTGRQHEAEADWRTGAEYEMKGEYGIGIGRSLQRVQGSMRIEMENIRQMVRLEQRANQSAKNQARYNQLKAAESDVLRGGAPAPDAPAAPAVPPAAADSTNNPFAAEAIDAGEPVPDAKNNPFQDDPVEPAGPASGADPFGGGAEPAGPSAGSDPFGGGAAGADPFGSPAPASPAAPAAGGDMSDPFGGSDPFGT